MVWRSDQVSEAETRKIIEIARECLLKEGDFVELGCYKGDTSLLLAEVLKGTNKKLWLYDSFEGLPKKSKEDDSEIGKDFQEGVLTVSKREVKQRFLRAGFKLPIINKAWFSELGQEDLPEKIALAFLDGDLYQSIKDSLRLVAVKMVKGGVIMIHDYNNPALPGVSQAVNEWREEKGVDLEVYKRLAKISVK